MTFSHFIEAKILPLDPEQPTRSDEAFVMSKIMACVHLHIENGHQVAVSFPGYSMSPPTLGASVRIFGSLADLAALLALPEFAQLIASAACAVGRLPLREVPENHSWEVFKRDRRPERRFENYRRKKAERTGRSIDDITPPQAERTPFTMVRSTSTGGRTFTMHVRRLEAPSPGGETANGYGLGSPTPVF